MKVRLLEVDFSTVKPHWAANKEFAQLYNAASTCPAHLEPYLVKVMRKAKAVLPESFTRLHDHVDIFIKQEMQHCKQHIAFNRMLEEAYPEIIPIEKKYIADYEEFLAKRSLQFNIAYSEGFEAMSAIPTTAFFEEFDALWAGADPKAEALWKWHLAEEYEHREVMHDLYTALYGRGLFAYLFRIWAFFFATRHIVNHVNAVAQVLLAKDREGMTNEELAASKKRETDIQKLATKPSLQHMLRILSPLYDPSKRAPPRGVTEILARPRASAPIAPRSAPSCTQPHNVSMTTEKRPLEDPAIDQLFLKARSYNSWSARQLDSGVIRRLYELASSGPTAANSSPARFVFVRSDAGRARLRPHINPGNLEKTMSAPCCVIVAYDTRFHELLPQLFPSRDLRATFEGKPSLIEETARRSATLEGAYLIMAARALGLDAGPMSGFNAETLDREFFPDGRWKSDFLCNVGYGTDDKLFPRNPRLPFERACMDL